MSDIEVSTPSGAAPPEDAREYVLWKALSDAPFPHWRRPTGSHFNKKITWEDVDWINSYINWFAGARLQSMRAAGLGSMQQQMLRIEAENRELRELLYAARDALDHHRLVQEIDDMIGALQQDIDL